MDRVSKANGNHSPAGECTLDRETERINLNSRQWYMVREKEVWEGVKRRGRRRTRCIYAHRQGGRPDERVSWWRLGIPVNPPLTCYPLSSLPRG